jgi:uncharacterized protein (TIGR02001 family)
MTRLVYVKGFARHDRAMRGMMIRWLLGATLLVPAVAHAQAEETPAVSIAYNVGIVSDYHFRGISSSNRKPAVQGGADVSFRSGWFAGIWVSSIAEYGGAHAEADLYGGYAGSIDGWNYSGSVIGYVYPGGRDTDSFELEATLARTIGPATATLTVDWSPKQWNSDANLYTNLGAEVAILGTPLTAFASIGRENGSYDEKWDWSAGLSCTIDALEISVSYVDSNYSGALEEGRNGRAAALLSVTATF